MSADEIVRRAIEDHLARYHADLETLCERMLTTPSAPGIRVEHYAGGAYRMRLDPAVPFGAIHEHELQHLQMPTEGRP